MILKRFYSANPLSEDQKIEAIKMYTGEPKVGLNTIARHFRVATQQITDALDEAGIPRKKNKKQIADGWKEGEKRPEYITATKCTPEYFQYLMDILAEAGRMQGEAYINMERLIKANPYVGKKRYDIKIKLK